MSKKELAKIALKEILDMVQDWEDKYHDLDLRILSLLDFAIYDGEELLEVKCKSTMYSRETMSDEEAEIDKSNPKIKLKIEELIRGIDILKNNTAPVKDKYKDVYLSTCRITDMVKLLIKKENYTDTILELLFQAYLAHIFMLFENNITYH